MTDLVENDVIVAPEAGPAPRPRTRAPRRKAPTAPTTAAERFGVLPRPSLAYTAEVAAETAPLYERVAHVISPIEWPFHAPYVKAINDLKKVRGAVILAHNYMTPEIFHCVADIVGDSLQLAREAAKTDAKIIVQGGVHFMAETSKVLAPDKTVLIPDGAAGCSLAASITGADVRLIRKRYPGVPIVAYVNTSAEVKAEVDVCCTSSNAIEVVESFGVDRVICLPDQYLARWVAANSKVKILTWKGSCEVHERFTGAELEAYRAADPGIQIIAHPECPPDVIAAADFTGSTAKMIDFTRALPVGSRVVLVTECSMADNVATEAPGVTFVRPCNLCPHMKRITLPKILDSLLNLTQEVVVDPAVAAAARRSVERMIHLKN
ncbi:quinolinate synthase NadA [Siculibacillus lacustris]|uniref:Quinolinate synthase n=1 Tax=Siculibacillus lacustris TaxID=1549641 RepID=A0A4Q9VH55_9HYPH|nr:quinolinate synthase NadA [Siculibacillus lacustris]TBW34413.1 quinolinate synthase NadA [Siculibacillus lacustris]